MKKLIKHFAKTLLLTTSLTIFGSLSVASTDLEQTISEAGLSGSFLASRVAIGDNDDESALKFLERSIALDPENPTIKVDMFIALVTNGRIEEAASLAKEAENLGQNNNLAMLVSATEALRKRSWNKASSVLAPLDGSDLDIMLKEIISSWAMFGEGKLDEALARLQALEGPDWILVIRDHHEGLLAAAAGKDALAVEKFQSVIDNRSVITVLTETYIRSVEAMVRTHVKTGNKEEAQKVLDFGRSLIPNHPPFVQLSAALDNDSPLPPLVASPQEGAAEVFFNIATAIKRDGGIAFAKTYLQLADYLDAESDVVAVALAELYLQLRKYNQSNAYYEAVDAESPFHRLAQLERASNLARLDRKPQAIELLRALIDEDPKDLLGYLTLGELFSRDKAYGAAAKIYDRAVEQIGMPQKFHWNLFFRRGIAYERLKQWDNAEPNFKKSLELSENQPEVLNYLGYSWIDQGINLDEGMDMIRKAVQLRPRSGFIVDSLGWAHYRLGDYEDAVRELERAAEIMPQDPTINDHLGDAYWRVGRKLEATFQWKIALTGEPPLDNKSEVEKKLLEGLGPEENSKTDN